MAPTEQRTGPGIGLGVRVLLAAAGLALLITPAGADGHRDLEYRVKAAFLHNFAKFVEWQNPNEVMVIGVLGPDTYRDAISATLAERSSSEHPYALHWFRKPGDLVRCDLLFVTPEETDSMPSILQRFGPEGILTVGEGHEFLAEGGVISFVLQKKKVRFLINPDAADRAKLRIRSELLNLATIVDDEELSQ